MLLTPTSRPLPPVPRAKAHFAGPAAAAGPRPPPPRRAPPGSGAGAAPARAHGPPARLPSAAARTGGAHAARPGPGPAAPLLSSPPAPPASPASPWQRQSLPDRLIPGRGAARGPANSGEPGGGGGGGAARRGEREARRPRGPFIASGAASIRALRDLSPAGRRPEGEAAGAGREAPGEAGRGLRERGRRSAWAPGRAGTGGGRRSTSRCRFCQLSPVDVREERREVEMAIPFPRELENLSCWSSPLIYPDGALEGTGIRVARTPITACPRASAAAAGSAAAGLV